jgi:aminoglycoside phosphotransferase (APT) family kinase protein
MNDVVATMDEAAALEREPLLILEPLEAFLDERALGRGPVAVEPLGDGHSNVTFLIKRGGARFVLRRPPRGPLPKSAHDVLREARLLRLLGPAGIPVPRILATSDDASVIGAPFYVMPFIEGHVLTTALPDAFANPGDPQAIGEVFVDALVALHAVDVERSGLRDLGPAAGYLKRQLRRFRGLLEENVTRALPDLHRVADWLEGNRPASTDMTVVHGDFRLGNVLFEALRRPRLAAILDWEMATLGDPLADLGYMTAMWAQADDADDPMLRLSAVTRGPGFARPDVLAARYAQASGRDVAALGWYEVLAVWKAAIFLESSYQRFLAGTTDDAYFANLAAGVPVLAARARRRSEEL